MTSIFGSKPSPQASTAPVPTPPPTMADPQSPDVLEAKRKATQEAMSRAGRSSTILSQAMGRTGAGGSTGGNSSTYGSTKTGAGV